MQYMRAAAKGCTKKGIWSKGNHWLTKRNTRLVAQNDCFCYLSKALVTVIRGTLENHNNRLRSLLFKWCVELNMMCHTIAAHFRADPIDRRELRAYAIDEVKRTNGQISFSNAIDIQRRLEPEGEWSDEG